MRHLYELFCEGVIEQKPQATEKELLTEEELEMQEWRAADHRGQALEQLLKRTQNLPPGLSNHKDFEDFLNQLRAILEFCRTLAIEKKFDMADGAFWVELDKPDKALTEAILSAEKALFGNESSGAPAEHTLNAFWGHWLGRDSIRNSKGAEGRDVLELARDVPVAKFLDQHYQSITKIYGFPANFVLWAALSKKFASEAIKNHRQNYQDHSRPIPPLVVPYHNLHGEASIASIFLTVELPTLIEAAQEAGIGLIVQVSHMSDAQLNIQEFINQLEGELQALNERIEKLIKMVEEKDKTGQNEELPNLMKELDPLTKNYVAIEETLRSISLGPFESSSGFDQLLVVDGFTSSCPGKSRKSIEEIIQLNIITSKQNEKIQKLAESVKELEKAHSTPQTNLSARKRPGH